MGQKEQMDGEGNGDSPTIRTNGLEEGRSNINQVNKGSGLGKEDTGPVEEIIEGQNKENEGRQKKAKERKEVRRRNQKKGVREMCRYCNNK